MLSRDKTIYYKKEYYSSKKTAIRTFFPFFILLFLDNSDILSMV